MTIASSIFVSILFFILTPSLFIRIPKKNSKYIVAGVHAVIFGFIYAIAIKLTPSLEGFDDKWGLLKSFRDRINAEKMKRDAEKMNRDAENLEKESAAAIMDNTLVQVSEAITPTSSAAPTTTPVKTTPAPTTTTPAPTTTKPTISTRAGIDIGQS